MSAFHPKQTLAGVGFRPIADIGSSGHFVRVHKRANWGWIIAGLAAVPLGVVWLILSALGGFGCEGAEQPCTAHYGTLLLGLAVIGGTAVALAALVNAVVSRLRH